MRRALHQSLTHVCTVGACGKKKLSVGLRRPFWGKVCGGLLRAIARIVPKQPSEAMARIAPRFLVPQLNGKQQNFPSPQLRVILLV